MRYTLGNGFWSRRIRLVMDRMIPLQLSILKDQAEDTEPSHAIENFRIAAGLSEGAFHGMVFQDSDVGKWIEAASYSLRLRRDVALEKEIDDIVEIIAAAQQEDGYLNTYFTLKAPGKRWTNLQDCHELYCFGHLTEGAVAYHQATGKTRFLEVMRRMADHICTVIGPEEGKLHGYPGHPEAELALYRLYLDTGEPKYLELSRYFIDQRGTEPNFFREEWERRGRVSYWTGRPADLNLKYFQAHMPVRDQKDATGHAVRALYLYAAMANLAAETGDASLEKACRNLWESCADRKMYLTGGLGATVHGEAFMGDYELPNDTAYAETCASVAMCFFARAMSRLERNGVYDDVTELELFNGISSGVSLQADRFFYVNPLEAVQGVSGSEPGLTHALPARPKWFACACCPPNLARLMTSLSDYCADEEADGIVLRQYLDGRFDLDRASLTVTTDYPWDGSIRILAECKEDVPLWIRIPGWVRPEEVSLQSDGEPFEVKPEKGYACLRLAKGAHQITLQLPLRPRRLYAHPRVRQDAGKTAFAFGPVIYCLEGCDNPEPLWNLKADIGGKIEVTEVQPDLLGGVRLLKIPGHRRADQQEALYAEDVPAYVPCTLTAIPYYAWANREPRDMCVWVRE